MVQIYNCKIGERVFYKESMTGTARTGVINSEPDESNGVEMIDITGMGMSRGPRAADKYVSIWRIVKMSDALEDNEIMSKIKMEAKDFGMTDENYKKLIRLI